MASDYFIVNKKLLPDYIEKVIYARELLSSHEADSITEAVKKAGISRNTYYKYKDFVFLPEEKQHERKAMISMILKHEPGVLSLVINALSQVNASIITISQSIPVAGKAGVLIAIDISSMNCSIDTLVSDLKQKQQVKSVHLDSLE